MGKILGLCQQSPRLTELTAPVSLLLNTNYSFDEEKYYYHSLEMRQNKVENMSETEENMSETEENVFPVVCGACSLHLLPLYQIAC